MNTKATIGAVLAWTALFCATRVEGQTNVSQWNFTNSNPLAPTIGSNALSYVDPGTAAATVVGLTTTLGIPSINGTTTTVMGFPASGATGGYNMPVAIGPNGGSPDLANNYT